MSSKIKANPLAVAARTGSLSASLQVAYEAIVQSMLGLDLLNDEDQNVLVMMQMGLAGLTQRVDVLLGKATKQ